jgi:D-glycerate 3-kinase
MVTQSTSSLLICTRKNERVHKAGDAKKSLLCFNMYPCGDLEHAMMLSHIQEALTRKCPIIVGVQGVQGVGKTYACGRVAEKLNLKGHATLVLSLDDFYHVRVVMGETTRGWPGTHDVDLLSSTLSAAQTEKEITSPVYDKTRNGGKGDRAGWRVSQGPFQVVLVEGWCLGFKALQHPPSEMLEVNEHLRHYDACVYRHLDALIVLKTSSRWSFQWRERAEAAERARGNEAMTECETRAFVEHYQPVYDAYLPVLHDSPPVACTSYIDICKA